MLKIQVWEDTFHQPNSFSSQVASQFTSRCVHPSESLSHLLFTEGFPTEVTELQIEETKETVAPVSRSLPVLCPEVDKTGGSHWPIGISEARRRSGA